MRTAFNVAKFALLPRHLIVLADKVLSRVKGRPAPPSYLSWVKSNAITIEHYCTAIDPSLWGTSQNAANRIRAAADKVLEQIPHALGGGGAYPLLYFLVTQRKPSVVVETGVAAGYSSYAILAALAENGHGSLYSSDFPYFRISNPERYIGCVVPNELRHGWRLYIDGDKNNIPCILNNTSKIDIFHYDSDKSYDGRQYALTAVHRHLADDAVIIIDDIQDNCHFKDYLVQFGWDSKQCWKILEFEGKHLGLIDLRAA